MRNRITLLASLSLACLLLFYSCSSTDNVFADLFSGSAQVSSETLASEYYDIANAYYELKKYDKAIEYYEKTQDLLPEENLTITYNLARIYAIQNKWENAERYYSQIFDRDQNNTTIGMAYAYVLAKQGKVMEASALYRGFYERNPADKKLLANFILALLELDEDYEASQLFEELKTLDEESEEAKKVSDAIKKKAEENDIELTKVFSRSPFDTILVRQDHSRKLFGKYDDSQAKKEGILALANEIQDVFFI